MNALVNDLLSRLPGPRGSIRSASRPLAAPAGGARPDLPPDPPRGTPRRAPPDVDPLSDQRATTPWVPGACPAPPRWLRVLACLGIIGMAAPVQLNLLVVEDILAMLITFGLGVPTPPTPQLPVACAGLVGLSVLNGSQVALLVAASGVGAWLILARPQRVLLLFPMLALLNATVFFGRTAAAAYALRSDNAVLVALVAAEGGGCMGIKPLGWGRDGKSRSSRSSDSLKSSRGSH